MGQGGETSQNNQSAVAKGKNSVAITAAAYASVTVYQYVTYDGEKATTRETIDPTVCPYPGLETFRTSEAEFFAGRETDIAMLEEKLKEHDVCGVIAASGAGKSSLVHAGLIPALAMRENESWDIFAFKPGQEPLYGLARSMSGVLAEADSRKGQFDEIDETVSDLRDTPGRLKRYVEEIISRRWASADGKHHHVLFFIDQWEELYTRENDKDRDVLVRELLDIAECGLAKVLLTMRIDFMEEMLLLSTDLFRDLKPGIHYVEPMDEAGLRAAIEMPANNAGLGVPEALTSRLIADLGSGRDHGSLPYLQFVLRQLWEKRDQETNSLTTKAYNGMKGLKGAIGAHADIVFAKLTTDEQRLAQRVLTRLANVSESGAITSRRLPFADFDEPARQLLRKLAEHERRLILLSSATEDAVEAEIVAEVAHEALLDDWTVLIDWIAERKEFFRLRNKLEVDAKTWLESGRRHDFLIPAGKPLLDAQDLLSKSQKGDMSKDLQSFIEISKEKRISDEALQRENDAEQVEMLRNKNIGLMSLAAFFGAAMLVAAYFWSEASEQRDVANLNLHLMEERRSLYLRDQTHRLLEMGKIQRGVGLAQRSLTLANRGLSAEAQKIASEALTEALRHDFLTWAFATDVGPLVAISEPSEAAVLTGSMSGWVSEHSATTGIVTRSKQVSSAPISHIQMPTDGSDILVGTSNGYLIFINPVSFEIISSTQVSGQAINNITSLDRSGYFLVSTALSTILLQPDRSVHEKFELNRDCNWTYAANLETLIMVNETGTISFLNDRQIGDHRENHCTSDFENDEALVLPPNTEVKAMLFDDRSGALAIGDSNGYVHLIDAVSRTQRLSVRASNEGISELQIDMFDGHILIVDAEGSVSRLSIGTDVHLTSLFVAPVDPPFEVFQSEMRYFGVSQAGTIMHWNLSGELVAGFQSNHGFVSDYAVIGEKIFTVGHDGKLRLWDSWPYSLSLLNQQSDDVISSLQLPNGSIAVATSGRRISHITATTTNSHDVDCSVIAMFVRLDGLVYECISGEFRSLDLITGIISESLAEVSFVEISSKHSNDQQHDFALRALAAKNMPPLDPSTFNFGSVEHARLNISETALLIVDQNYDLHIFETEDIQGSRRTISLPIRDIVDVFWLDADIILITQEGLIARLNFSRASFEIESLQLTVGDYYLDEQDLEDFYIGDENILVD